MPPNKKRGRESLRRSGRIKAQSRAQPTAQSRAQPNGNSKPPKRARQNVSPLSNKLYDGIQPSTIFDMSYIIALEIVGKPEVRQPFQITTQKLKNDYLKHPNFINLVVAVQKVLDLMLKTSRANMSGTPDSVTNVPLTGVINLKNITNVYVYLARKMGDLIHDLESVKLLKNKLGLSVSTDIVDTFKAFLQQVKWLNPEIKRRISSASPEEQAIFEQVHGALRGSVRGANKISESTMNQLFAEILMQGKTTPLPYITTAITNIERIQTYQAVPSIVFDQTSKASGPNFYGQIIQMFPNQIVTQNLGLATMSDFAGRLPSSPERGYMFDMVNIIKNFFTVGQTTVWRTLNKYSLNVSSAFTSQVMMGDVEVQTSRTIITNKRLRRQLMLGGQVIFDGVPLSAKKIKDSDIDITICENKTGLDFDMIVFAKSIGAIHSTGDVSACGFNQDLAIMGVRNNFVNENTSMSVSVSIGTGEIKLKSPPNMPVETKPNAFVTRALKEVFKSSDGFTPANIQKLSNAFRVGNGVSNAKRSYLINKVKNGTIQPGYIKKIIKSSRNANALRSELEKRRLFTNVPSNSGGPVEEESLENKTTLNRFRASLKSKGVSNARINSLYTILNTPNLRSQVMNSRSRMLIAGLKNENVNRQNVIAYVKMFENARARNLARSKQQVASNPTNINQFIAKFPRVKQGYNASEERVRTDIRKLIKTNINRGKKNNGGIERHVLDYINFNKEIQRVANQSIVKNQYISLTPEEKLRLYLNIGGEFSNLRYSMNENTPEGNINNKRKEILRRYIITGS